MAADIAWYAEIAQDPRTSTLRKQARKEIERAAIVDAYDVVMIDDAAEQVEFLEKMHNEKEEAPTFEDDMFSVLVSKRHGRMSFSEMAEDLNETNFGERLTQYQERGKRFEGVLVERLFGRKSKKVIEGLAEPLTQRETEVLRLLVEGLTNKEVAEKLIMSPRTAEVHVANILGKMDVNTRARAISKAVGMGIVPEPA